MIDAMLAAPGVIGARQARAGFGGCMVAFVHAACVQPFEQAVSPRYASSTGIFRVLRLAEALENGDTVSVRKLCGESFRGARDLYEICSPRCRR